mmetsp:Transcript_9668/g.19179  ORF Transcript_9668/g.19179 Transcript_9668/m.19179 type:complete len:84 (-) Transcript_9668:133-384(-)
MGILMTCQMQPMSHHHSPCSMRDMETILILLGIQRILKWRYETAMLMRKRCNHPDQTFDRVYPFCSFVIFDEVQFNREDAAYY